MEIKLSDWIYFRDRLSQLSNKASDEMIKWLQSKGGYAAIPREEVIEYAHALATKYGEASAALSAEMYDTVAFLSNATVPLAEVAPTATVDEVGKAINGALKFSKDVEYLSNVVGRFVKQSSQDTTLRNAARDGAQFAWIPAGDTCAFCLTLASRGWQNISKKTLKNGHAEHIHSNCDCAYAVRFNDYDTVEGYDPDKYYKMYSDAEGRTPKDKINAMRREGYAEARADGASSDNSELLEI